MAMHALHMQLQAPGVVSSPLQNGQTLLLDSQKGSQMRRQA